MSCLERSRLKTPPAVLAIGLVAILLIGAIESQVYVAVTGTVGNLPVEGLGLHYGQAAIITPSDFPFARDGIAAEGVPNH